MRPLSSAYHQNVITGVIKAQNPDNLKNLVLSSRELFHSFDVFMETARVMYYLYRGSGSLLISGLCRTDCCSWISHFVRNLELTVDPINSDSLFFNDLCRFNILSKIECFDRVSFSMELVRKLISVTRQLIISYSKLNDITDLIPRYEILSLRNGSIRHSFIVPDDDFTKRLYKESGNVLDLILDFEENDFNACIQEKFEHVTTVCYRRFTHSDTNSALPLILKVIMNSISSLPNVKNINLHIGSFWHGTLLPVKDYYNELVSILRRLPSRIIIRLDIPAYVYVDGDHDAAQFFSSADFSYTFDESEESLCIKNRHHQLTDNVELFFEVFVINLME